MILAFLHKFRDKNSVTVAEWFEQLWQTRTGIRLRSIVGQALCVVRNTMDLTSYQSGIDGSSPAYIQQVISEIRPRLVLGFGRWNRRNLPSLWPGPLILAPHPAAHYLVNGDPLFYAIKHNLNTGSRFYINRDRSNRITKEAL